ncbi:MAG: MATE family efflux transporter [Aureispira sp.]|nr:MATE family efflux transporter [Aureispira sp.]
MQNSKHLGELPIPKLLVQQAVPAFIGILILSIYGIVDTIFVGRWVGPMAIAAITVVLPITFLIASIGMAIGVGGASIISRALGGGKEEKAFKAFGNQVVLTLFLSLAIVALGVYFQDQILLLFGAQGAILPYAREYFSIILIGIPFLAWAMMSNNVIQAEGAPKVAMFIMIVPAVVNLILDPILIISFDMGLAGAAWATTISYIFSAAYAVRFFIWGKSELKIKWGCLKIDWAIVREIFSIGIVTLARQGAIAILAILLNNTLFTYGDEFGVAIYGIINRVMMFANSPVLGVTQGFIPIAGYNYGAKNWKRVRESIRTAVIYGTVMALFIFVIILVFSSSIVGAFTTNPILIAQASPALKIVFVAAPLISIQLVGAAYFQAAGKVLPALLLTLTKQGFCLIPLVLILPYYWGLNGIWIAFPMADVLAAIITYWYLRRALNKKGK